MAHHSEFVAPFAGSRFTFALPWKRLEELEEAVDGSVFRVLNAMTVTRQVRTKPMREIIRLALIGGGTDPATALKLVERYVEERPLMENFDLACQILEAGLFGSPEWQASEEGRTSGAGIDPAPDPAGEALKTATLGPDTLVFSQSDMRGIIDQAADEVARKAVAGA